MPRDESEGGEIGLEAPLDAGPQHLDGDGARPGRGRDSARCTCAIEAAATGGPKLEKTDLTRLAERGRDRRFGLRLRERRHLVLQAFEIAGEHRADHVRPRRQELAELHIGRAEPRSAPPTAVCPRCRSAPFDQPRQPQAAAAPAAARRRIDQAEHAFAREHEAGAAEADEMGGRGDHNRQPRMQRHDAAGERLIATPARKPAARIMSAKACGLREAADRFDQIAIGLGVAGHRAAERRDDVERIEVVERVEAGNVDGGEFEAEKAAADASARGTLRRAPPRCAARCGCRRRW